MNQNPIYLDAASTEKLHPKAKAAMLQAFDEWINPAAANIYGQKAKLQLENARKTLKNIFNIKNNAALFFISSASEGNNIIFNQSPFPILISCFEHSSCSLHPKVSQVLNFKDLSELESLLQKQVYLVSLSLVHNESGMLIVTPKIVNLIHKYGSKLHVDASQAKEINFNDLGCDYMTLSSHKIGGPVGIAGLVSKTKLAPVIYGGGQEFNVKSGTQALPLIMGFMAAAEALSERKHKNADLYNILQKNLASKYFFSNFVDNKFCNHILCLLTYDIQGTEVHAYMDLNNVIISYGSACASGAINSPKILNYFDVPSVNGIRLSFGWHNNSKDILYFCDLFNKLFKPH